VGTSVLLDFGSLGTSVILDFGSFVINGTRDWIGTLVGIAIALGFVHIPHVIGHEDLAPSRRHLCFLSFPIHRQVVRFDPDVNCPIESVHASSSDGLILE
jgi:hypothetical protein